MSKATCFSPPGFRFSVRDGVVISIAVVGSVFLWRTLGAMAMLFPIVVFHFFLFCNVFRVRRSLELIWAAAFVINVTCWSAFGNLNWLAILLVQSPITLLGIGLEMSSSTYHGIGYSLRSSHATKVGNDSLTTTTTDRNQG